jgi:hypothetical protein
VDSSETCVAVTVYNIALGYGVKIGDAVAIPEPYVQNVDVHHKEKVNTVPVNALEPLYYIGADYSCPELRFALSCFERTAKIFGLGTTCKSSSLPYQLQPVFIV